MIKRLVVSIKGLSPLLMHAFPMVDLPGGHEKWDPEKQAEIAEYRTPDGKLYIPGVAMQRALIAGATFVKGRGRSTMQKPLAACLLIDPEYLIITPQTYIVDSRPVVIPATKGRIVRHRPKFSEWSVTMNADIDDALVGEKEFREIVDYTGSRVGLLDFRPERKGPFGRFIVTEWKIN